MAVVNKKTHHGIHLDDVYIGRPGPWGNPFSHLEGKGRWRVNTREEAVEAYRQFLWGQIQSGEIKLEELAALHGKTLLCWCKPLPCHGDVLARAAAWAFAVVNS